MPSVAPATRDAILDQRSVYIYDHVLNPLGVIHMESYTVGVAGLGRGRGFANVFNDHPRVMVTALCDTDEKRLQDNGRTFKLPDDRLYTSFDEFVAQDFDIAAIASPNQLHTEHTIKALESGKHVLCENRPWPTPWTNASRL